jgi:hypothetical protein
MKSAGVCTLHELNWADLDVGQVDHVVYLVRPQIKLMKQIASQVRAHQFRVEGTAAQRERRQRQQGTAAADVDDNGNSTAAVTFHLCFAPRRSLMCEQVLKDQGVAEALKGRITEFPLGFIPFDNDVMSMELDMAFRQVTLEGDR